VSSSPASSSVPQETQSSTFVEGLPSSQVVSSSRAGTTSQISQSSPGTLSTRPNNPTVSPSNNQTPSASPTTDNNNSPQTMTDAEPSVTQQVIYRTTLPNGSATTITSITVVPAEGEATGRPTATKTKAGNAGLQTGAATRERSGINAALVGALGMAAVAAL
jgi:hypothetical protein